MPEPTTTKSSPPPQPPSQAPPLPSPSQAQASSGVASGSDYLVRLDQFEGPLDLLLYLIRRAEVDITEIPIATIADQYVSFITQAGDHDRLDIDLAGDFLVMAATLMEIKSRMLMPPEDSAFASSDTDAAGAGGPSAEDQRTELVRQLLAYKKYRDAADALEDQRERWHQRVPCDGAGVASSAVRQAMDSLPEIELEDLDILDLVSAFEKIVASVNFDRLGEHTVAQDDTPIELHAADLLDRLKNDSRQLGADGESGGGAGMPLFDVFAGKTRSQMIGLFLAMLELTRQGKVRVYQRAAEDNETDSSEHGESAECNSEIFIELKAESEDEEQALGEGLTGGD